MNLTAEEGLSNWIEFNSNIEKYITGDRKQKLLDFYKKYEDRVILMPAAHKREYHSAFPGGYVYHVNRVVNASLKLYPIWDEFGMDKDTFTIEELVFSAINHDLGKMGDADNEAYIPQTDKWRREKLGEEYMFNTQVPFASVPDRSLFLLQSHGIQYSFNEMVAIQTHDGLYDEANSKYLKGYLPEQKPRTSLPFLLHQADLMSARLEFEMEWLPKLLNKDVDKPKKPFTLNHNKNTTAKSKALGTISSPGLKSMLDSL